MNPIDRLRFIVSVLTPAQLLYARAKLNLRDPRIGWQVCGKVLDNPMAASMLLTPEQIALAEQCCVECIKNEPTPWEDGIDWEQCWDALQDPIQACCIVLDGKHHGWLLVYKGNGEFLLHHISDKGQSTDPPPEIARQWRGKDSAPALRLVDPPPAASDDESEPA